MKIVILTSILLLVSTYSFAQNEVVVEVPKGTSKIILTNDLNKEENFKHVIDILLEQSHFIASKDSEFGTIKTEARPIKGLDCLYYFSIRIKDQTIIISGSFKLNMNISLGMVESTGEYTDIANKGMKGSPFRKSFEIMHEFSKKLKYSQVKYEPL
jgi:hypothetical protein